MGRKKKNDKFKDEKRALSDLLADFSYRLSKFGTFRFLTTKQRNKFDNFSDKIDNLLQDLVIEQPTEIIPVTILQGDNLDEISLKSINDAFTEPPNSTVSILVDDHNLLPINSEDQQYQPKKIIFISERIGRYYRLEKGSNTFLIPVIEPDKNNHYWIRRIYHTCEQKRQQMKYKLTNKSNYDDTDYDE